MFMEDFDNSTEGVLLQTKPDAGLFKVEHFKAKTMTTQMLEREREKLFAAIITVFPMMERICSVKEVFGKCYHNVQPEDSSSIK